MKNKNTSSKDNLPGKKLSKTRFTLIIPLLIVVALTVTFGSIYTYMKLISSSISKTSDVIKKNYDIYRSVALDNFSNSVNGTLSMLQYISLHSDQLLSQNTGTVVTDFSDVKSQVTTLALTPDSVSFLTKDDITQMMENVSLVSDIYTACDEYINGKDTPSLFFCDELNNEGYYILYPCSKESDFDAMLAFYNPTTFIVNVMHCETLSNGMYSLYANNNGYLCIYDSTTDVVTTSENFYIDDNYELINTSTNNTNTSIIDSIASMKDASVDVKNIKDDSEYHIYYETLYCDGCDIVNLHSFIAIPNKFDLTYNSIDVVNKRTSTISYMLSGVFIVIIVIIIVLLSYYNNMQVNSNKQLELETKRYKSFIQFSKWLIWEYNYAKEEIVFLSDEDTVSLPIEQYKNILIRDHSIIHEDIPKFDDLINQLKTGNKNFRAEFRIKYDTTDYKWYEFVGQTINDDLGNPITAQIVANDIDEQKKALESAKDSSEHDPLTGVLNLHALKNHTENIIEDKTSSLMHAMLIVDFDNFKAISDNYGQTFGDAILIEFTSKISSMITTHDKISRVDSDKFIIFLHNIPDITFANGFATDIFNMSLFDNFTFDGDSALNLTCSIGIALFPNHADTFDGLISAVDIALYHAKKNGRNCCVMYDSSFSSTHTDTNLLTSLNKDTDSDKSSTSIDNELVFNIVDMMFSSKDVNISIPLALSLVGNYYNLDQIGIIEYNDSTNTADCNFSWNSKEFERYAKENLSVSRELDSTISFFSSAKNEIYYTNKLDLYNMPSTTLTDILKCAEIQSLFQCATKDKNTTKGYLFATSTKSIDWDTCIADTMTLITKVIYGALMKQHTEEDVKKLSKTDLLTGSDNLATFVTKATSLVEENPHAPLAMVYLDIDRFKLINDKYGYSTGDHVIISLSDSIASSLQEGELYARADADKFIMLLHFNGMSNFDNRIMTLFSSFSSYVKEQYGCRTSLIAGVYLMHDDTNITASIDRANIARKNIKDHHNTTYEIFNESMKSSLVIINDIEDSMEAALENNEFKVFYQPKTNIFTNKICGSEALVRWERPKDGLLSPAVFIPLFEDNGFIVNLDYYVFENVCATLRKLIDDNVTVYPVSVNFSRVHLKNNKILRKLEQVTKKYNIDPSLIEIEITESALSEGDDFTPTLLNGIRNIGFKLSMDDFGCGLSSLNSLRKFPFDILKLDKEFFNNESIDEKEQIVVKNVVNLAKQLNMSIVAEGIETTQQLDFLRSIDCPVVQGYVYSPPLPEDKFIDKYLRQ